MSEAIVLRLVVRGRVQGVGFRAWMTEVARARGLNGWVRNRRDGTVEAVFGGPAAQVEAMAAACRQGPPGARVDSVERDHAVEGVPSGRFVARPTT